MIVKKTFKKLNLNTTYIRTNECDDPEVKLVAKALLNHIIQNPDSLAITYKDLSAMMNGKIHFRNLDAPLGNLSTICLKNNLPPLSCIVINQEKNRPGDGFFRYFFPELPKDEWDTKYIECLNEVKAYTKWNQFLNIF